MVKSSILAGFICLLQSTGIVLADAGPDTDLVLAEVNEEQITLGHVISYASSLPEQFKTLPDEVLFNGVLDQLIQQVAIGSDVDRSAESVRIQLENEARTFLAAKVLTRIEQEATTEEKILSAFRKIYLVGPPKTEYRASHILVETEEAALGLVVQLENGADFAQLAQEKSTGPTGPRGGDLGWFLLARMVPEFGAALSNMQPGEISAPVQTQYGWHVIRFVDTRVARPPSLEDVRAEIVEKLALEATNDAIAQLESTASISRSELEVEWSVIRRSDLLK